MDPATRPGRPQGIQVTLQLALVGAGPRGRADARCHHRATGLRSGGPRGVPQAGGYGRGRFLRAGKAGCRCGCLARWPPNRPVFVPISLPPSRHPKRTRPSRVSMVDVGVMAYVLQFVPQEFASIPRHGMIQYHPSLLPRYRGPSSINWPIIRGDTRTGLSDFPTDRRPGRRPRHPAARDPDRRG